MDCSLPGSSVHGDSPGKNARVGCHALLQGTLPTQGLNPGLPHCRWILYNKSLLMKVKVKSLSPVRLFGTPWTAAHQAPPSMGFSRQEYWSGVPLLPAAAKSLQSCLTLCDPIDCSPPGVPVSGILQARTLEWVAISFSRGSSRPRDWTCVSRIPGRHFNL